MTEKQKRFADEYLIDLNGTRAYKAAYPSVRRDETAAQAASRLLRNVKVAAYIKERMADRRERVQVRQDEVLGRIMEIAFATQGEDVRMEQVRLRALELLGKHLGLFDPKDALDREEQRARIEKLRADVRQATAGTEAENALRVVFVNTDGAEI